MARQTTAKQVRATVEARIKDSDKKTRAELLASLLANPPQICRFGLRANTWRRESRAAVAGLPSDHFVAKTSPGPRPPSVLWLLRSLDDDRVAEIADAATGAFRGFQVSPPQAGEGEG